MSDTIFSILDDLESSAKNLKKKLAPLASFFGGDSPFPMLREKATRVGPSRRRRRVRVKAAARPRNARRKAVSSAVRAKRVLQGKYLAALRPLSKAHRKKVKAIYAKKGQEAAIRVAERLRK